MLALFNMDGRTKMELRNHILDQLNCHDAIEQRSIIIAAANPKGGSGKTTLSVGLYGAAIECGLPATLIDADEGQNSAKKWLKDDLDVLPMRLDNTYSYILGHRGRLLFVDTGGSNSPYIDKILLKSDVILIPISDSPLDRVASVDFYTRLYKAKCNAYFVFTGIDRSDSARSSAAQHEVRCNHRMVTMIPRRVSAKDAAGMHVTIQSVREYSHSSMGFHLNELFQEVIFTVLRNRAGGGKFGV